MKIGGIVAEYNPFHNGHRYQIEKYRKEKEITHLVVAMSGNFVQRGGPAVFDKYARAEMAIKGGADLVIEIPSFFATQTAELYARGAVLSLEALGCLDSLCFGTETGELKRLVEAAEVLSGARGNYGENLKKYLAEKIPFPAAREKALIEEIGGEESFLSGSNNILGIEYIKELMRLESFIEPFTVRREGSEHNSTKTDGKFSSATGIRNILLNKRDLVSEMGSIGCEKNSALEAVEEIEDFVPKSSSEIIERCIDEGFYPVDEKDFFQELCYEIIRSEELLEDFFEVGEGLENLIRKEGTRAEDFDDLLDAVTSKRYTKSKIRRCLFNILLGVTKEDIKKIKDIKEIPYIRVLAFNRRGTEILKEVKNKSDVLIVKSPAKVKKSVEYKENHVFRKMIDFDIRSSNIYYQKYYRKNRNLLKKGEPDFITLKYMML